MALDFDWKPKRLSVAEEEVFTAAREAETQTPGPHSQKQDGVPTGELRFARHTGGNSGIWPDISRDYFTYIPANHDMAAALAYRHYEFRFEFGLGGHNLEHGGAVMPQTLKWIFRN